MGVIEDCNYYNDGRVRARDKGTWYDEFDEKTMTAKLWIEVNEEGDEELRDKVSCKFEVCYTCGGKGKHVNPSIDSGGLTGEDFAEDPDLAENYFSGMYDVTCYECGGKRVIVVPDDEEVSSFLEKKADFEAQYHAERMAEIRMGC